MRRLPPESSEQAHEPVAECNPGKANHINSVGIVGFLPVTQKDAYDVGHQKAVNLLGFWCQS